MRIDTLSTFPEMFDVIMGTSIMGRAQSKGLVALRNHDLRLWTHDRHRTTDDAPYGGGPGLIMKCEPIFEAHDVIVKSIEQSNGCKPHRIFLAPFGEPFSDRLAGSLASEPALMFVCGHYEGIDERAYELADSILSIGDYVISSGELAALVVMDAVVRKIPGVLGADEGLDEESFTDGLLEYPQYTRPAVFRSEAVPEVLLSGNHEAIARWRHGQALWRTAHYRPDLLTTRALSEDELEILKKMAYKENSSGE